jgi:F-type H+-transporting ATPase subunit delta
MASGAAKRYTQAVFGLAKEKGNFDQWQTDLARLNALVSDERAAYYLASPNVSVADKQALLDATLVDNSQESRNLARLLLQRHRLEIVPEMFVRYQELVLEERGIAVAEVTTAEPLDERAQEVVKAQLRKLVGKDVELRMKTDPAIIGGIIARVGDQLIDGSVINQLRRLRARLAAAS